MAKNDGQPKWPNGIDEEWFRGEVPPNSDSATTPEPIADYVSPVNTTGTETPSTHAAVPATPSAAPAEASGAAAGVRQDPAPEAAGTVTAAAAAPAGDPSIDLEEMMRRVKRDIEGNRNDEQFVGCMTNILDTILAYQNANGSPSKGSAPKQPTASPEEELKKVQIGNYTSRLEAWLITQATNLKNQGHLRELWYNRVKAGVDKRVQDRLYFKITSDARTYVEQARAERGEISVAIQEYVTRSGDCNKQLAAKRQEWGQNKARLEEEEKQEQDAGKSFGMYLAKGKTLEANAANFVKNTAQTMIIELDHKDQELLAEIEELEDTMHQDFADMTSLGHRRQQLSDNITAMTLGLQALQYAKKRSDTRKKYSPHAAVDGVRYNDALKSLAQDITGLLGYIRANNQRATESAQGELRLSDVIRPALTTSIPGATNGTYDTERRRAREERHSRYQERQRQMAALYQAQSS